MSADTGSADLHVRRVADHELGAWARSVHRTFQASTPLTDEHVEARRPRYADHRLTGAFDGGAVVGTFRSWDVELPLPGGVLAPASAISSVTVSTTHRRRGVLTRMMAGDLREAAGRGTPLAVLIASEGRIYGRFGFGPAVDHQRLVLDVSRAGLGAPRGVELVEAAQLREVAPGVHERARLQQPGAMPRTTHWWDVSLGVVDHPDVDKGKARYHAVHRDGEGRAQGYLTFHVEESWPHRVPRSTLVVDDLGAATAEAHRALWALVASTDMVASARADDRGVDDPLPLMTHDPRAAQPQERADFLWVRVLDVPAALRSRRYAVPGSAVLEVRDELAGQPGPAAGRWRLEVGDDGAAVVEPTTAAPGAVLPVQALGAALLGQQPLLAHAAAGRVEGEPGAVRSLSALLHWPSASLSTLTWF